MATSIATFSPPLPATATADELPRILVGLITVDDVLAVIAVDGGGRMELLTLSEFLIDWRYDTGSQTWDGPPIQTPDDFGDEEGS